MKVLFAHNTLTSYPPKGLKSKLLNFMAKCQAKCIDELWESSVRGFDIRIRVNKGKIEVSHGMVNYNVNVYDIFKEIRELNVNNEQVFIRIVNEDTFQKTNVHEFAQVVSELCLKYPEFKYQIVDSKKNWNIVMNQFTHREYECYSKDSITTTPKKFADKYNESYYNMMSSLSNGFFWFDFI